MPALAYFLDCSCQTQTAYMFGLAYFLDQTYSMSNLVIGIDVLSRPRTVRLRARLLLLLLLLLVSEL